MSNNTEEMEVMVGSVPNSTDDTTLEVNGNAPPDEEAFPVPEAPPPKPKHTRKKKADTMDTPQDPSAATTAAEEKAVQKAANADSTWLNSSPPAPILTVEAGGAVETEENLADLAWHEIHNAYRTRRILTGFLGGLEQTDAGKTLAIVEYKGFRVVIPLKEMVIGLPNNLSGRAYSDVFVVDDSFRIIESISPL